MTLTAIQIKNAKPQDKDYKITDGEGLYLLVTKAGGKLWKLKYRFAGKEKKLSCGEYPYITLQDARVKREEAKKLLANGIDPSEAKKFAIAEKQAHDANTFSVLRPEQENRTVSVLEKKFYRNGYGEKDGMGLKVFP